MLYSIVVNFKAEADAVIPPTRGYHAYALFLNLLRAANPDLAEKLHNTEGAKPFTLSPLQGKFRRHEGGLKLTANDIYWIRLTFLHEEVFAHFLDASMKGTGRTHRLADAPISIDEILTTPDRSPMCRCQALDEIFSNARAEHQVRLEFLSPTAFRSGGKRNVIFPEPRLVFNSYLVRWQNLLRPLPSNGVLELVQEAARVSQYQLETRILHFGSYQEIGFEGKCTIEIAGETPEDAVRFLNALADFAFYCGTGAKTAMGMGQTRRLNSGGSLSGGARGNAPQG
ncbi:MAG: CRISPR-associated endoribonuclease Cas6 [Dehalococcoidia bacterium]|nr:CRISPR-associated endoribonuclease Cas6 [Dehalococcoidia bacterium]